MMTTNYGDDGYASAPAECSCHVLLAGVADNIASGQSNISSQAVYAHRSAGGGYVCDGYGVDDPSQLGARGLRLRWTYS